jgi:NAD(P)-dependent dehydrogenase (short-subunit alcohol dehydrogenase family)
MEELKGRRRALVTGATRGIGRATAIALARSGWDVALTGRTRREGEGRDDSDTGSGRPLPGSLESTAAEVQKAGGRALALVADLHDHPGLRRSVSEVIGQWGGVDLLVNNAVDTGPGSMVPIVDLTIGQLEAKLAANVVAPMVLIEAVLPGMRERGRGLVVNVTSHTATADPPGPVGAGGWGVAYAASKAALHRFAPLMAPATSIPSGSRPTPRRSDWSATMSAPLRPLRRRPSPGWPTTVTRWRTVRRSRP